MGDLKKNLGSNGHFRHKVVQFWTKMDNFEIKVCDLGAILGSKWAIWGQKGQILDQNEQLCGKNG